MILKSLSTQLAPDLVKIREVIDRVILANETYEQEHEIKPNEGTFVLGIPDLVTIREALEKVVSINEYGGRDQAVQPIRELLDTLFARFGYKYQYGFVIPPGHYLDRDNSVVLKDGMRWDTETERAVPIEDMRLVHLHIGTGNRTWSRE